MRFFWNAKIPAIKEEGDLKEMPPLKRGEVMKMRETV